MGLPESMSAATSEHVASNPIPLTSAGSILDSRRTSWQADEMQDQTSGAGEVESAGCKGRKRVEPGLTLAAALLKDVLVVVVTPRRRVVGRLGDDVSLARDKSCPCRARAAAEQSLSAGGGLVVGLPADDEGEWTSDGAVGLTRRRRCSSWCLQSYSSSRCSPAFELVERSKPKLTPSAGTGLPADVIGRRRDHLFWPSEWPWLPLGTSYMVVRDQVCPYSCCRCRGTGSLPTSNQNFHRNSRGSNSSEQIVSTRASCA